MKDIITNELCFTSFDTADVYRIFIEGIIAEKRFFTISAAAATCSDLPCTVTGYEGTVTVDHWITFNNKTNTVEYLEDSGDNGVFKTFKTFFFKFPLISSVPVTVWWGGKTLSAKNKNTIARTVTTLFGPRGSNSVKLQRLSSTIRFPSKMMAHISRQASTTISPTAGTKRQYT